MACALFEEVIVLAHVWDDRRGDGGSLRVVAKVVSAVIPCDLAPLARVPLRFAKGRLFFELATFYEVVEEVGVGF